MSTVKNVVGEEKELDEKTRLDSNVIDNKKAAKNIMNESVEKAVSIVTLERELLSTPFRPSYSVTDEIIEFFNYIMEKRSFPKTKEFENDLSKIKEQIELLLITRSVRSISLCTEDMKMQIKLSENPYEGEIKLSEPILVLKPLPAEVSPVLTIEMKDVCPSLVKQLTNKIQSKDMQVLKVNLKEVKPSRPVPKVKRFCNEILPKIGIHPNLSDNQLDSLERIFRDREDVKALTLIADENRIIFPKFLIDNPRNVNDYKRLVIEFPKDVKKYSVGLFSVNEVQGNYLIKDKKGQYKDLSLEPFPEKEQLIHYICRIGKENNVKR